MMSFTYRMSRSVQVNSRRCLLLLVFATVSSACAEGRHGTAPEPSNRRTVLPDREGDSHPITIYPAYVQRLGTAYRSPDIRTVTAAVEDAFLNVEVNFAPGTFDPARTRVSLYLDTDDDASTGAQRTDLPSGADHMITFGASGYYPTSMHHIYPSSGRGAVVRPAEPYEILANGLAIRIPLQRIGTDNSRFRFYVAADVIFERGESTMIMDGVPGDTIPTGWIPLR